MQHPVSNFGSIMLEQSLIAATHLHRPVQLSAIDTSLDCSVVGHHVRQQIPSSSGHASKECESLQTQFIV